MLFPYQLWAGFIFMLIFKNLSFKCSYCESISYCLMSHFLLFQCRLRTTTPLYTPSSQHSSTCCGSTSSPLPASGGPPCGMPSTDTFINSAFSVIAAFPQLPPSCHNPCRGTISLLSQTFMLKFVIPPRSPWPWPDCAPG